MGWTDFRSKNFPKFSLKIFRPPYFGTLFQKKFWKFSVKKKVMSLFWDFVSKNFWKFSVKIFRPHYLVISKTSPVKNSFTLILGIGFKKIFGNFLLKNFGVSDLFLIFVPHKI